jgi:NAD(P)-dependent dehydrogenase (short-subunit alcohol dehydrogenase family)
MTMAFDEHVATGRAPLLEGKVAVITGVGAGIGRAAARLFQAAGATVVGNERDAGRASKVAEELGIEVVVGDVTEQAAVDALTAAALDRHGRIDVVYNNAGVGLVSDIPHPAHLITDATYDLTLDVNLRATFLVCRSVLPHMLERGGAIVNASSIYGVISSEGSLAYAASKASVLGLTRSIACDYASHRIRCNAICPGFIDTNMPADFAAKQEDPEQTVATIREAHLLKRMGLPEEIAATAAWLCSDAATFITGAAILADGGYTAI